MALEEFIAELPTNDFTAEEAELFDLLEGIGKIVPRFLPRVISVQEWAARRCPDNEIDSVNASRLVAVSRASASARLNRQVIGTSRQARPSAEAQVHHSSRSFSGARHENAVSGPVEPQPP